jgi:hypothetical protein
VHRSTVITEVTRARAAKTSPVSPERGGKFQLRGSKYGKRQRRTSRKSVGQLRDTLDAPPLIVRRRRTAATPKATPGSPNGAAYFSEGEAKSAKRLQRTPGKASHPL